MKPEDIQTQDYGETQGKLASHRWLGANTVLSKYYGYDEQTAEDHRFSAHRACSTSICSALSAMAAR